MMNTKTTEKVLAEALEEKEQRIKELTDNVGTLKEENKALSAELKTLSEKQTEPLQSMVTWKDHQATIEAYVNKQEAMAQEIAELKSNNDKLCEERRYWATQQWAKHLFRWLFLKRHWFFWGIYVFYNIGMGISVYHNVALWKDNQKLLSTEMKYRFIRALNVVPLTLQYLDDAFEGGDARKLQIVHTTVKEYEQALRQKSDSIIRTERKKAKELR
jgi:hypothetical protein